MGIIYLLNALFVMLLIYNSSFLNQYILFTLDNMEENEDNYSDDDMPTKKRLKYSRM